MITADYHLHSSFSGDSKAPMENMIQAAIKKGMTHICFTEHMDMDYPVSDATPEGMFTLNTDSYLYDLARFKEKYAKDIKILFGVELGIQPHLQRELALYARAYEFDFIIGSTHVTNGKDPYFPAFYEGRSEEEAYREYFNSIIDNIKKFKNSEQIPPIANMYLGMKIFCKILLLRLMEVIAIFVPLLKKSITQRPAIK